MQRLALCPGGSTGHARRPQCTAAACTAQAAAGPGCSAAWQQRRRQRPLCAGHPAASAALLAQRQPGCVRCRATSGSSTTANQAAQLLDKFWLAQGVTDEQQRRQLVAAAGSLQQQQQQGGEGEDEAVYSEVQLPSLSAAWFLEADGSSPEVAAVSRRILALQQLLGGSGVDVVWMLVREPRLLSSDFRSITQRLFDMKLAEGSEGLNVVRLVEQQPALLLAGGAGVSSGSEETAAQRLQAWQHGLVSDSSPEWARRYHELQQYHERYGDAHVGFRDGDEPELSRWAAKQRSEHKKGQLDEGRKQALTAAGFEFDTERAEWMRWMNEIKAFQRREGHCQPHPLAHPNDFLLINWCSVQRIMRRCKVLAPERVALLDDLQFDWSGADPLS